MLGAEQGMGQPETISFCLEFVHSEAFSALFQEGMELAEEAVVYLEGEGRAEADLLSRDQAAAYADESGQLTSRLMQIASWLMAQRALADETVSPREAILERKRLTPLSPTLTPVSVFDTLPKTFRELSGLTARLYTRIQHLEELLLEADCGAPVIGNPVAEQRRMIEQAFARKH